MSLDRDGILVFNCVMEELFLNIHSLLLLDDKNVNFSLNLSIQIQVLFHIKQLMFQFFNSLHKLKNMRLN